MRPDLPTLLRWGLLVSLIAFLVYLGWLVLGVQEGSPAELPTPLPEDAETSEMGERESARIEAMDFTRTHEGEESLRIRAQGMTAFADGVKELVRALIHLPQSAGGEGWDAQGDKATVRDQPPGVTLRGNVLVTSPTGARLKTAELSYDEQSQVASAPGKVEISKERNWVRADGMTYESRNRLAVLAGDVRGALEDPSRGEGGTFRCDRLTWKESTGEVLLEGGVRADMGVWLLEAPSLRVESDEHGSLRRAVASGGANLRNPQKTGRSLQGDQMEFVFGDEEELRSIISTGQAKADLLSPEGEPVHVEAHAVSLRIGPTRRAEAMEAEAGEKEADRVLVTGLPGVQGGTARSRRLNATLDEVGGVREAVLEHEVELSRGDVTGLGDLAIWRAQGDLELLGSPGILTPKGKAFGDKVVIRPGGAARLEGKVHSVMEPSDEGGEDLPMFTKDGGPVFISADSLDITPDGDELQYRGSPVQAKQGDSSILAEALWIHDKESRVRAEGSVRSRIRMSQADATEGESSILDPNRLVDGVSEVLEYEPLLVTYEGEARLSQGEDWVSGDTIWVHLQEGESGGVRNLRAEGDAQAKMGLKRGWGDALEYRADQEQMLLWGLQSPARAEDAEKRVFGEGKLLTIYLESGQMTVESDPIGRTVSVYRSGTGRDSVAGGGAGE